MSNSPLHLTEDDVADLVTVQDAIATTDEMLAAWHHRGTANLPRQRAPVGAGFLNLMGATFGMRDILGFKVYFGKTHHFMLYSISQSRLLAIIESSLLSKLRTGAASGVATRAMARPDSKVLGVIGTGSQSPAQLAAVCAVRPIEQIRVFSRTAESRETFARDMENVLGVDVRPAQSAEACVEEADVVVLITRSATPVCRSEWLADGVHVNAAGANAADRRELDAATVLRAKTLVTDHRDQAKVEAAEFIDLAAEGRLAWSNVHELTDVVSGKQPGRGSDRELTLFRSLGIALEDVVLAELIYRRAVEAGIRRTI